MRVVYVGCVDFSERLLRQLLAMRADIVGVVTKEKSGFNADFRDLMPLCKARKIPVTYTRDINSPETIRWIRACKPDVIYCFGWSNLIKEALLSLPPLGVVGYHPAELPKNRGRHPLIWALVLGLKRSASTFFFMGKGADDGDILSQEPFDILDSDDAGTVYSKVAEVAKRQLFRFHGELQSGTYERRPQDHAQANVWRKRSKADGIVRFSMSSRVIYNLVRGLTHPYVGASYENADGQEFKIWRVEVSKCPLENLEYGKVIGVNGKTIRVKTADGAIDLVDHEIAPLPVEGDYL